MEHYNPLDDGRGAGKDENAIGPHSESEADFISKPEEIADNELDIDFSLPKPQNQFEKFLGFHDYKSGFGELSLILKKQGAGALAEHIKSKPLPTFQEYLGDIEHAKPELYNRVLADIALNSHGENLIIREFNELVYTLNKAPLKKEEAEKETVAAYNNLVAFFEKYSNSFRDNVN